MWRQDNTKRLKIRTRPECPLSCPGFAMLYRNHGQPMVAPSAVPGSRNRLTAHSGRRGSRYGVARCNLGFVMTPPSIGLEQVTLRRGGRDVVRDLAGSFTPGTLTAVAGPNGAGKSTLLLAMCGLLPVASGRITRGEMDARAIALLPQEGRLDRSFPITCRDVVALGWTARLGLFRRIGREHYVTADRALASVGLDGLGSRSIGALSAGQFQRVLFARTIVRDAPVILLDEPFSAVDATTEADLMAIVRLWHRQGRTVVAVLHDLDLIRAEFPRTLLLGSGGHVWGATNDVLTTAAIRHARLKASITPLTEIPGGSFAGTSGRPASDPPVEAAA
jgi:zinc/manganese transport system ATP-binding protein